MKKISFIVILLISSIMCFAQKTTMSNKVKAEQYVLEGVSRKSNNDLKGALLSLSLAINLDPYNADAFFYRGEIHEIKGSQIDALNDYTKACNLRKDKVALYKKGLLEEKQGKIETAITDYTEAIKLDSNDVNPYLRRALCYNKTGNTEEALADINVGLLHNPANLNALYLRSGLYAELQNFQSAINDLTRILLIDNKRKSVLGLRGYYFFIIEDYEKAYNDLNEFIIKFPDCEQKYKDMRASSKEKLKRSL